VSYLARLKADDSEKCLPKQLTKPTKAPSVSSVSAPSRHSQKVEAREPTPDRAADTLPDPVAEARRQRALAMLRASPGVKYGFIVDEPDTDPVVLTLAVRGVLPDGSTVTCELLIPRDRYDAAQLLDLIASSGSMVH